MNDLKLAETAVKLDEGLHHSRLTQFQERAASRLEKIKSSSNILMGLSPRASWPGSTENDVTSFPEHLFGKPLQFVSLHGCADYIHYNFMCYTLSLLLRQASDQLLIFDPTQIISDNNRELEGDPRHFADNLCRCVPYMCNFALHGSAGAMMIQHVLIDIFPSYGVGTGESIWIVSVFQIFWRELGLEGGNKLLEKYLVEGQVKNLPATV